jgi:predicted permease
MILWRKLKYLLPSHRRAEERDMHEELKSLKELAGPHELGNLTLAAEDARAVFTWMWLDRLGQDLRYALRSMAHNKTFTALAMLSLALGIGANTAMYSFMESILLRTLPVPEPKSLVVMKWRAKNFASVATSISMSTGGTYTPPGGGTVSTVFPYPALKLFQSNKDLLSSAFCYFVTDSLSVTVREDTEAVTGQYVSGDYFGGMGVRPAAGRLILVGDDEAGTAAVAVLSYRFSIQRFGDASRAVDQSIRINDKPFTVVGVAPQEFFGAEPGYVPDIYVPLHANLLLSPATALAGVAQQYQDQNFYWIEVMGRLNPGVSLAQAQAVLAPQFHRFVEDTASNERERADLPELMVTEGATGLDSLRRHYSTPVFVLMGMAGLILLVACANIANLLLARAAARRREIAVRLSMGASRLRVIRQLLTESVLLALLGGALGVAFAAWGIRALTLLLANGRDNFTLHAELNWTVLNFTIVLSVLTGLLFGLAPAIHGTGFDVVPALKQMRTTMLARKSRQTRNSLTLARSLVVAQIAFSFLLLVAAGLFLRTLSNLHAINLGFNREGVLLFTIKPQTVGYSGPALNRLYADLQQRLSTAPGVRSVSLSVRPLPTGGGSLAPVVAPGAQLLSGLPSGGSQTIRAGLFTVGPAFFETMQIPLTAGREFNKHDLTGSPLIAIVNERLVKMLGMDQPVGHTVAIGKTSYQIVGVVGDAVFMNVRDDPRPMIYVTYLQNVSPPPQMTYELRALGNPLRLTDTVRQIVRQNDSRLAISGLETQETHIDQAISQEITLARLCTVFAALALLIACVGLYGTVAYNVERRTSEIGIRVALGAQRPGIIWMILREVLALALVSLVIGIPAALAGARTVKSLLYGIPPNDPVAIVFSAGVLLMAGLLAAYLPARCASRIDPMIAVRHE